MYGQSLSQSDGYKMVKPTFQHHTSGSKHSSMQIEDSRKNEALQKHKLTEKALLQRSSSHSSKSSHDHYKHHKVQGALRTCGIWSEHRSSSGKIYFYNNVSEVSQWEKPKEWNDVAASDVKPKDKTKPVIQKISAITKNSSLRHGSANKVISNNEVDKNYRHKDYCDRDYRSRPSTSDHDYKDIDYRNASLVAKSFRNNSRRSISADKDYRSLNTASSVNAVVNHASNTSISKESYVPTTGKFYDYSSWNVNDTTVDTKVVNGVTAQEVCSNLKNIPEGENNVENDSNNAKLSATSEFVRKLSNVLSKAASSSNANSVKSEEHIKDVFQLLLDAASKSQNDNSNSDATRKTENPDHEVNLNDAPPEKRSRSSESEDKNPESDTKKIDGSLQAAKDKNKNDVEVQQFQCLEELRPLFDQSFITHIQNWPSEHNEKQCSKLSEDFHRFVADFMSELNVKLTTSRSKVRTSEIISTIQEQRILYIRQQIKDLEKASKSAAPYT